MLKVKRKERGNYAYLYAQIKIDRKVKDFYIGLLGDVLKADRRKLFDITGKLEKSINDYCYDYGITHKFNGRRTLFGLFIDDLGKLEKCFNNVEVLELSQKVGYINEETPTKRKRLSDFNYDLVAYAEYKKGLD